MHPAHHRKLDRIRQIHEHANTFEAVAREWLESRLGQWTERTCLQRKRALEVDVFPMIGALPVNQVTPAHVLEIVKRVEKRAPAMAVVVNQALGAICRHAVVTLRADNDATAVVRGALNGRAVEHRKPLESREIGEFFTALEADPGSLVNKIALRLIFYTLVRPTEALEARWAEFDLDQSLWVIPAERMKMRESHRIPLPPQTVELLQKLTAITGNREHLFPNRDNPRTPVSRGVLWKMVSRMGYGGRFSPHGIRATGSTILNEMGYRADLIERELAHTERNNTRAAYNRASYLPERQKMMQEWANILDGLVVGGEVIALHGNRA